VTVHPVVGRRWLFELKPQVVFTEDGRKPIESKPKMARLRKASARIGGTTNGGHCSTPMSASSPMRMVSSAFRWAVLSLLSQAS
jgi:hypothetical protein